ncbi:MAG: hypothetical protein JSS49_10355 [Planctomycetes bacterium]|nr:hypothetical protein [Planctomycetota bacterium]
MKNLISLKMEVRVRRVITILLAIPVGIIGLVCVAGFVLHCLGYDDKTVRRGMSAERVREILGLPDQIAILELPNGKLREDWWYSNTPVREKSDLTQLTFESGRLVSNHSKNQLPQ